jgi:hypothetical protein
MKGVKQQIKEYRKYGLKANEKIIEGVVPKKFYLLRILENGKKVVRPKF